MTDKSSPPKITHGFGFDSMSTKNFQALRPGGAVGGGSAVAGNCEVRNDSMSSTNFQALSQKAKPALQPSSKEAPTPPPAKGGTR